jgi:cellulose synthase/poly-beta-1,6-N-acetylglucosamine synthase-like glycosyltransferase
LIVLAGVAAACLMGLVVMQSVLVWGFVRALRGFDIPLVADDEAPRAVVILCLRGTDPFLKDCLMGLFNQDYPNYRVRLIVDSSDDPVHLVLSQILDGVGGVPFEIENLQEVSPNCSLKCNALRQVLATLDQECQIIAQLDADTIPHRTWLRELATALQADDVLVATGNRWYMPQKISLGSVVRYTWNAAAVVQMHCYKIPWGGTVAYKSRLVSDTDFLAKLGNAFCEDTMLHSQAALLGMRVAFVPSLMMINRENVSLGGFYRWVTRQLLNARLYHPAWPAVVLHGVVSTLAPLLVAIMFGAGLIAGNEWVAVISASAFLIWAGSMALAILPMELSVRAIVARRGDDAVWIRGLSLLKCVALMVVTQVVYPFALFSACFAKSTDWRGIDYEIKGPWQIRMKGYQPYDRSGVTLDESL